MINFTHKGDFSRMTAYLKKLKKSVNVRDLDKYGKAGVAALSAATPVGKGLTSSSWYYEIENKSGVVRISFNNSNVQEGVPIAIILRYGHATGTGGWVEGRDYIDPAIQPLFDEMANEAWREVTSL